jgi:prepilin-type N-terminal cleavage/methylation domain-containing protein
MNRVSPKLTSQSGVSLVELLVVIIVIAIVASMALMSRGSANEQFQRQNASRELKVAFERARFDSVKRRADGGAVPFASVTVNATSFTLVTDANQDGDIADAGDSLTLAFAANINASANAGSLPITVTFNRRGEPSLADASFVVCNGTCDFSNDTPAIADIVHVTRTGTVNLLPGGSAIPSFTAPGVTAIPPGTAIRSETYVGP